MPKILIVDDQAPNRKYLSLLLNERGYEVVEASHGAEGLEVTRRERPDLVITDLAMPVMDGYEFVRRLRGEREIASTRVIFYSATYLESEATKLAEAGGVSFMLTKPSEPEEMLRAVERTLGREAPPVRAVEPEQFNSEHLQLVTNKLVAKLEETEAANHRLEAQYAVARVLAEAPSVEEAIQRILRAVCENLGWEYSEFCRMNEAGEALVCDLAWSAEPARFAEFEAEGRALLFTRGEGLPGMIWAEGMPLWIEDISTSKLIVRREAAVRAGLRTALGFGVAFDHELFGVMQFFSSRSHRAEFHLFDLLESFSNQTGQFLKRKQAEAEATASREQLRALTARLQEAREEEGARISREIHDELGAALTGLRWDIESLEEALARQEDDDLPPPLAEKIAGMYTLIDETINVVRRISAELRPAILDDLGLTAAIEWQAQQFEARTGIEYRVVERVEADRLSRESATATFRIFQEILTNVMRHAGATRIAIRMWAKGDRFFLEVEDDGRGIRKDELKNTRSLGLLGMRERAHLAGGTLEIVGRKGQGTTVIVSVPLRRPAVRRVRD